LIAEEDRQYTYKEDQRLFLVFFVIGKRVRGKRIRGIQKAGKSSGFQRFKPSYSHTSYSLISSL